MISAGYIIHYQTLTNRDKKYRIIIPQIINENTLKCNLDCNLLSPILCVGLQGGSVCVVTLTQKKTKNTKMDWSCDRNNTLALTAMFHNICKHLLMMMRVKNSYICTIERGFIKSFLFHCAQPHHVYLLLSLCLVVHQQSQYSHEADFSNMQVKSTSSSKMTCLLFGQHRTWLAE